MGRGAGGLTGGSGAGSMGPILEPSNLHGLSASGLPFSAEKRRTFSIKTIKLTLRQWYRDWRTDAYRLSRLVAPLKDSETRVRVGGIGCCWQWRDKSIYRASESGGIGCCWQWRDKSMYKAEAHDAATRVYAFCCDV